MKKLYLNKDLKYLLACSYGPDSMALFYLLKKEDYKFDAAIVNYHLRKESDLEVKGLLDFASRNDIKVYVYDVKENINKNIEARCREIRYKFFSELCNDYHYDAVLVAQHQDDHIETYLLQKNRQNCPNYYGIAEKTVINGVNVIRPLLNFTKSELESICVTNNVPFMIDKSNFDTNIKRNKIRHEFVSKLTRDKRAQLLNEIDIKNKELESLIHSIDFKQSNSVSYLLSLDDLSRQILLNNLAKKISQSYYLSKENVGEIIKILNSKKPNVSTKIKSGIYLIKEYDSFRFDTSSDSINNYSFRLDRPGLLDTDYFYLDFSNDSSKRNVSLDDYPLTIRNIYCTDYYVINGYKAKARRLLIDWKVPSSLRKVWPVILNNKGEIIYIPRYQKDFEPDPNCNFYVKAHK